MRATAPADDEQFPSRRAAGVAALVLATTLLVLLRRFYHDDGFIVLRYARNLLAGNGIVWNAGERVEGYTSLLWVLGCALLGRLGVDLQSASRVLGVVSLGALLLLLFRREGRAGASACAVLAATGPLVAWSVGGLETVGFTLLVTAGLLLGRRVLDRPTIPEAIAAGALLGLAELCRPEGTLFALVLVGALVLAWIFGATRHLSPWPFLSCAAGFGTVFVPRLVWRLSYYGGVLPNTYYVKAGSGLADAASGLLYLAKFALFVPAVTLLAAVAVVSRRWAPFQRGDLAIAVSVLLYASYLTWIGGDHMQWFRMVVPVIPVITLVGLERLSLTARAIGWGGTVKWAVCAVCLIGFTSTLFVAWWKSWAKPDPAARYGEAVGRWMGEHWPPETLVALNTAGSSAYFSNCRCIDMLGLNDSHIARRSMPAPPEDLRWALLPGHRKGDGDYVLARRPDVIVLGGSAGEGPEKPWFIGDREIVASPAFLENYSLRSADIAPRGDLPPVHFKYFLRNDAAPTPAR